MSKENQPEQPGVGTPDMSEQSEKIAIKSVSTNNYTLLDHQADWWHKSRERYLALEELLEFAAESGKLDPPDLAVEVKKLKQVLFYKASETLTAEELSNTEAELEKLYVTLTQLLSPINILTLRATSERHRINRPWWQALFLGSGSIGRNLFRQLFWIGVLLVGLIFWIEVETLKNGVKTDNSFINFIEPLLYGALGALVYLYKRLTELYTKRALHPNMLAIDRLRVFMGALAGTLIVKLFQNFVNVGEIFPVNALGFLAGYSVEFFYQTLDRSIRALLPRSSTSDATSPVSTPRQAQIDILTKRLKEMTNEEDKAAIRRLLEKI